MPAPAPSAAAAAAHARPRASNGKPKPKPRPRPSAPAPSISPTLPQLPPPSAALELPDFMREDDDDEQDGGAKDAAAQEARYDASYNTFMDELDREDDNEEEQMEGPSSSTSAAAQKAGANNSLSVFSTSLLPNRSTSLSDDEDEDEFNLFAPRARAKDAESPALDLRDADDPAYAQGLADILGSDNGDEDDDEAFEYKALSPGEGGALVPSPSALEDALDAEQVEAELSVDIRDDTFESGDGLASHLDEDEEEEDDGDGAFVYTPSAPPAIAVDDDDDEAEESDDDFVYRPGAETVDSLSAAPQLPPIIVDSSTPPVRANAVLAPAPPSATAPAAASSASPAPASESTPLQRRPPPAPRTRSRASATNTEQLRLQPRSSPSFLNLFGRSASGASSSHLRRISGRGGQRSPSISSVSGQLVPGRRERTSSSISSASSVLDSNYLAAPITISSGLVQNLGITGSTSTSRPLTERDILALSSLRKIASKLFASSNSTASGGGEGGGGLGEPTVLAAGAGVVAVGTSRGWVLVFALDQELRCVVGTEALAQQGGSVTALSFSLDSTFLGVGHASGHIALYDLSKPSLPARQVAPVSLRSVQAGRKEGHLPGCAIVQLEFVGRRHTAVVSADAGGVAVYHALGKILGVSSNDTLRIFGQYPSSDPSASAGKAAEQDAGRSLGGPASDTASINGIDSTQPRSVPTRTAPSSKSILFGVQPLPVSSTPHLADTYQFVAILTPHKLVLVGLKPGPRTWWRKTAPRSHEGRRRVPLGRLDSWNNDAPGAHGSATPRREPPEVEDFADGLEVGDEHGYGGGSLGSSPLRLVRGIPEGRTADDFAGTVLPGDGTAFTSDLLGGGTTSAQHGLISDDADDESLKGALCGALAWQPASELPLTHAAASSSTRDGPGTGGKLLQLVHPVLAFSFGRDLFLLHLVKGRRQIRTSEAEAPNGSLSSASAFFGRRRQESEKSHQSADGGSVTYEDHLGLQEEMALVHRRPILGLQWLSPDLLLILDAEGVNLFDLRVRRCTERQRLPGLRAIPQRWDVDGVFHPGRSAVGNPSSAVSKVLALTASHSFRIHEGRAFLLGAKDVLAGTALSWTDRIITLVSAGDFLSAIELAQAYYEGKAPGSVIGLPSDRAEQKRIVEPKLRDLMKASASYAFSPIRLTDNTHVTPDGRGVDRTPLFEGMARVCALACLALDDLDFLFGDLYELYAENGIEGIFVSQMEEFIVNGRMRTLPTDVVQRLVAFRKSTRDFALAERIIYHVDPLCLDLDQAIGLCLEERLYDALIYVYTEAMDDFIGPIVTFIEIIKQALWTPDDEDDTGKAASIAESEFSRFTFDKADGAGAYTLFVYLSAGLVGLAYPLRKAYPSDRALKVQKTLFGFVFAGACVMWPQGAGGKLVQTLPSNVREPTYPYLRLFLRFDADALLEVLETAFEDSFVNDEDDEDAAGAGGSTVVQRTKSLRLHTRQKIVDLLLQIAREEADADDSSVDDPVDAEPYGTTLLASVSGFVARNAPKYPQFIKLSPTQVDAVFEALTQPGNSAHTHEERQLATEYLLSTYKVADGDRLLQLLEQAGFWRLLQDALRRERRWDRLIGTYIEELQIELDDEKADAEQWADDGDELVADRPIFGQLEQVLGRAVRERTSWLDVLGPLITEATPTLLQADVIRTVALIERFFPGRHHEALDELAGNELGQLAYLRCFYDPAFTRGFATATAVGDEQAVLQTQARARVALELLSVGERLEPATRDRYIALLARHRPDDLVQAFDAQPWAEYVDRENGGRFLFDKHFGAKALGRQGASSNEDQADEDKEPSYREVKPFLDGMTSAYRLRMELLGMANRLFDRDLFGDLNRLAARRVRGWRPRAAISGPLSHSTCGACGEILVNPSVGPVPTAAAALPDGPRTTAGFGERPVRPRISLRDRRRSSSMISLPPPRPPSSPFIEAAAGGPAKPDKGKGVSRGYFPPFEDSLSPSISVNGGFLSPDQDGASGKGSDSNNGRNQRIRNMSPHGHAQLRALSLGGPNLSLRRASSTPLLGPAVNLSPALGVGVGTASAFADMQASDTQPADLFAPDAAALGLPPDEEEEDTVRLGADEDADEPDPIRPSQSWALPRGSTFHLSPLSASRSYEDRMHAGHRTRTLSEGGVISMDGAGQQPQRLGESFAGGLGLLMEDNERDEALVVFANGEVRHRRCCQA